MNDPSIRQQIRSARGKFVAMAASYSLGVFNDNFFKQAAMLLAIVADMFVWFTGSVEILVINVLGKEQFGYSGLATSGMLVAELGGLSLLAAVVLRLALGGVRENGA